MPPPTADIEAACSAAGAPLPIATRLNSSLCPDIPLNLRPELWASWQTGSSGDISARPPYWALAWPGGQALARYILDHPEIVAGRKVVEWGAGCGLAAIAAALSGARQVRAIDRDELAVAAINNNALLNGVSRQVRAIRGEVSSVCADGEVILAADLWYDRFDAVRITSALRANAERGAIVLIGDSNRAFAPRCGLAILSRYLVPTNPEIEQKRFTNAYVARFERAATGAQV
jgi:predicted nicotinamide N-methyase